MQLPTSTATSPHPGSTMQATTVLSFHLGSAHYPNTLPTELYGLLLLQTNSWKILALINDSAKILILNFCTIYEIWHWNCSIIEFIFLLDTKSRLRFNRVMNWILYSQGYWFSNLSQLFQRLQWRHLFFGNKTFFNDLSTLLSVLSMYATCV